MQLQLNLILAIRPPRNLPRPKAAPHRSDLDKACDAIAGLTREAVQRPSPANLQALQNAVIAAHGSLLTLQFVEETLCHEQKIA